MAPIIAAAGGALAFLAVPIITRILLSLGIGVVSFIGISIVFDFAIAQLVSSFNGLPAKAVAMAAIMKVDVAANIIIGCVNARLGLITFNGLVSRFQIDPAAYSS